MNVAGPRGRGRPADPGLVERRRADLIDAATEVFAEIGYTKAGVADITRRAGLGKGTFYQYFDSKKDVFDGVVDRVVEEVTMLIMSETGGRGVGSAAELEHGMRTVAERLFAMADERPQALQMLVEGIQDEDIRQRLLALPGNLEATLATTLRHNADAGFLRADLDFDFLAHVFLSVAMGGLLRLIRGDLPDSAARAEYVDSCVALTRRLALSNATQ